MIILQVIFILFCLVVLLVLWILLAPLVLFIDSGNGTYYMELVSLAKARLVFDDDLFKIRMRIFFIHFNIDPFKPSKKKKEKEKKEKKKPAKKKKSIGGSMAAGKKFITEMIRSFSGDLRADIDTGNVITNAYLVPAFVFLNREGFRLRINYTGTNTIRASLQNRLIIMLFIFIKFRIRSR
ncbi:MAG TPA: hypothetical protein VE870_06800 [Bacteroidales bacterium]|nr:hypothetical protein [Bacteroidales bacterium]